MEANSMAAMREALVCLRDAARNFYHQILNSKYSVITDKYTCCEQGFPAVLDLRYAIPKANFAISKPPRNCDAGSSKEQNVRYEKYCFNHRTMERCCQDCPLKDEPCCELAWAQLPYEAQEGCEK